MRKRLRRNKFGCFVSRMTTAAGHWTTGIYIHGWSWPRFFFSSSREERHRDKEERHKDRDRSEKHRDRGEEGHRDKEERHKDRDRSEKHRDRGDERDRERDKEREERRREREREEQKRREEEERKKKEVSSSNIVCWLLGNSKIIFFTPLPVCPVKQRGVFISCLTP